MAKKESTPEPITEDPSKDRSGPRPGGSVTVDKTGKVIKQRVSTDLAKKKKGGEA